MYTDLSIRKTLNYRGAVLYNGVVRRLQRHGLKADGVHGKVDKLHISYDGNRIKTVIEDADPVTQNGSMDYPGGKKELEFTYNDWGALVSDPSRGITDISYDNFGNPLRISFSDGGSTENVYSATGEKLKATHTTSLNGLTAGKSSTEYHGPLIYVDGRINMALFPGGYVSRGQRSYIFHYYTQDYLSNNRAVINGSTGAIEQLKAYYPYGGVIADLGTPTTGQPYKFGGKELITANGLNEYDFGARRYYQAIPHFTSIDPMAEKYPWLSPYLFCANNPVNLIDPSGMIWENPEDADFLNSVIKTRINEVINGMFVQQMYISENSSTWTSEQLSEQQSVLDELSSQLTVLSQALTDIKLIDSDKRTYVLDDHNLGGDHHVVKTEDGKIHIQTSSEAITAHEITHLRQSLVEGKLSFKDNLFVFNKNYPKTLTEYECEAYKVQYSIDPLTMPVKIDDVRKIDGKYLKSITYPGTKERVYPFAR